MAESRLDHPLIGDKIAVRDHHPFGVRGRARGVLQKGDVADRGAPRLQFRIHLVGEVGACRWHLVDDDPADRLHGQRRQRLCRLQHRAHGEDSRGFTVPHDVRCGGPLPMCSRRYNRHSDNSCVQAPEVGDDEVRTLREHQERSIAGSAARQQPPRHLRGLPVQFSIGQSHRLDARIIQKDIRFLVRIRVCAFTQQLRQRRRFGKGPLRYVHLAGTTLSSARTMWAAMASRCCWWKKWSPVNSCDRNALCE